MTTKKLTSKVAYLWHFGFFFSASPSDKTAQNWKFILEIWLKTPLSTTLWQKHTGAQQVLAAQPLGKTFHWHT